MFRQIKVLVDRLLFSKKPAEIEEDEVVDTAWALAKHNEEFLLIETCSGYRMIKADPRGKQLYFPPDVDHQVLGLALLEVLSASRIIHPLKRSEEDLELFDWKKNEVRYKAWIESVKEKYRYKTNKAMFKNMASCHITRRQGTIEIVPTFHDRLQSWSGTGIEKSDHVIIPSDSDPAAIGAALKLAFSRCI